MTQPPKDRIRQSFERAAATYDAAAHIQRQICQSLAAGLPAIRGTPLENRMDTGSTGHAPEQEAAILDAGCGTGYALDLLRQRFPGALLPGGHLLALDLSPAMLARADAGARRLAGDLERLPLAPDCLDLYWSSLALQWCRLPVALTEARRALRPGGWLAAATLGPGTFAELEAAFAGADAYRHTLAFHTPSEVAAIADVTGFVNISVHSAPLTGHYPDLRTLLGAVKAIGANQVGPGRRPGLMGRQAWQRVEAAYEAQRQPAGLPLTYDVITLYAQK